MITRIIKDSFTVITETFAATAFVRGLSQYIQYAQRWLTARMTMQHTRVIKRLVSCRTNELDHMFINQNACHLARSDLTLL
jgi:hypothetical protein